MLVVVCYDIRHDRRRYRLQKLLRGYGHRVQKSVFECHVDARQAAELRQRARGLLKLQEDCVTFYRICATCEQGRVADGAAVVTAEPMVLVL